MGDRGHVRVLDHHREDDVYLYTHWGAKHLAETVAAALAREERWSQPSYLTRIIFSEMIRGSLDSNTSFGIQPGPQHDINTLVTVDPEEQTIHIGGGAKLPELQEGKWPSSEESIHYGVWDGTFKDFVDEFHDDQEEE